MTAAWGPLAPCALNNLHISAQPIATQLNSGSIIVQTRFLLFSLGISRPPSITDRYCAASKYSIIRHLMHFLSVNLLAYKLTLFVGRLNAWSVVSARRFKYSRSKRENNHHKKCNIQLAISYRLTWNKYIETSKFDETEMTKQKATSL